MILSIKFKGLRPPAAGPPVGWRLVGCVAGWLAELAGLAAWPGCLAGWAGLLAGLGCLACLAGCLAWPGWAGVLGWSRLSGVAGWLAWLAGLASGLVFGSLWACFPEGSEGLFSTLGRASKC